MCDVAVDEEAIAPCLRIWGQGGPFWAIVVNGRRAPPAGETADFLQDFSDEAVRKSSFGV
jgi:hypothetical protein